MKTIKVSEATELQLDWLVAKCLGEHEDETLDPLTWLYTAKPTGCWDFCTNWAQGGPILGREITKVFRNVGGTWSAMILKDVPIPPEDRGTSLALTRRTQWNGAGPTPLIAVMRCLIASKLGSEVEVPELLTCSPTPKND